MSQIQTQKKVKTDDVVRLNSIGLSLMRIGEILGCHATTVTHRLRNNGIFPADTRRSFMEDIYNDLSPEEREWLMDQVSDGVPIKDYVKELLRDAYKNNVTKEPAND